MNNGILDWFSDPGNQGLLAMASGLMQAGGPQRFPVSTGQAIGMGMESGLGAYNQARQLNSMEALRQAQMKQMAMHGQLSQVQLQQAQGVLAQQAREQAFRQPGNLAQFMTGGVPARPEYSLPEDQAGPVQPAEAAVPGRIDPQRLLAGAVAAGVVDPLAFAKEQIAENAPKFAPSRSPGYFQGGKFIPTPENIPPKEDTGISRELQDIMDKRDKLPVGSPGWKFWDTALKAKSVGTPAAVINMPNTSGTEIVKGDSLPENLKMILGNRFDPKKSYTIGYQIGRDGAMQRSLIGESAARPKEPTLVDQLLQNANENKASPSGKPAPTQVDRDWVKTHPNDKQKFINHFGVDP